jgi:hypothetical protein
LSIAPVLTSMAARRFANDAFVVIGRGTHMLAHIADDS